MRQKRKKFSGKQDELSLLEEELAKTKEQLRQKEKELHSLQDLTGYLHPTHNSSRRLSRLPLAVRAVLQVLLSFFKMRAPYEFIYRKGLIVASSTFEKVNRLIEQSLERYPKVDFQILADDRFGEEIAARWPDLQVRIFDRALSRKEKFLLIVSLIKEDFDVCLLMFAGDKHYDFLKAAGLLSGSTYIKAYNEFYSSFFVMAKQLGVLQRHLAWRSKQTPVLYSKNGNDDKTVIPRKPHRLTRLPWAIRVVLQISMPLIRLRFPDEAYYRKGIIIASSTFEKVNLLVEQSIKQYCKVNFLILADDRYGAKIAERWPNLEVRVAHRGIGRREKFALIGSLIKEQYDVCMMLYAGDEHYDFLKLAGLLSGSGYIKEYNEFYTSFFVMAKQFGVLLGHLAWRSKQRSFTVNSNPHLHAFFSFYTLVSFQIVRTGIGYLVSFVRIIPMLRTANRIKNAKNPFLEE